MTAPSLTERLLETGVDPRTGLWWAERTCDGEAHTVSGFATRETAIAWMEARS